MLFLRTKVAHSASEMDALEPLWNALLQKQAHTIFQQFRWNQLCAELFRNRLSPHVVAVESDAGAAIIPAAVNHESSQLEMLGERLFDYRDVLHTGDLEILRVAWKRLGEFKIPLGETIIGQAVAAANWSEFSRTPFVKAPGVDRALITAEGFRAAHRRLGRHFRRIQKYGVVFQVHRGADSKIVRRLYARKCKQFSHDPHNIFDDPLRREFMVAAAAEEGQRCNVFTLETRDSELVAGLLTFTEEDCRRFYTIYFDPAWKSFSPGLLLIYEATARSLAEGLSCDYMTGEQAYKLRLANTFRQLYKVTATADEIASIAAPATAQSAA